MSETDTYGGPEAGVLMSPDEIDVQRALADRACELTDDQRLYIQKVTNDYEEELKRKLAKGELNFEDPTAAIKIAVESRRSQFTRRVQTLSTDRALVARRHKRSDETTNVA